MRKLQDETSYKPEDLIIYPQHYEKLSQKREHKKGKKTTEFWLAELKDSSKEPKLNRSKHSEFRWLTAEQIPSIIDNKDFIKLIKEFEAKAKSL